MLHTVGMSVNPKDSSGKKSGTIFQMCIAKPFAAIMHFLFQVDKEALMEFIQGDWNTCMH